MITECLVYECLKTDDYLNKFENQEMSGKYAKCFHQGINCTSSPDKFIKTHVLTAQHFSEKLYIMNQSYILQIWCVREWYTNPSHLPKGRKTVTSPLISNREFQTELLPMGEFDWTNQNHLCDVIRNYQLAFHCCQSNMTRGYLFCHFYDLPYMYMGEMVDNLFYLYIIYWYCQMHQQLVGHS